MGMGRLKFSIITPSYRQSEWLKLCIASVADQNVHLEHIVQDAGSDDGTLDWLLQDKRVKVYVEKDQGMYDAINRGFQRASGDILAYLNCDEQYLPGALASVEKFFLEHPEVDIVFGDVIVVGQTGEYLCHRKMLVPLLYHTWACHLATLTCATFVRRHVIQDHGMYFDIRYKAGADGVWMVDLLKRRFKMAVLRQFTSVFTWTGENLSKSNLAQQEADQLRKTAPLWAQVCRPLITLHHRIRKLVHGIYFQQPFEYQIYTRTSPNKRVVFQVLRPKTHWPR